MRYSDTHCDFLYHKISKNKKDLELFKYSNLLIQVFAIFVNPDIKNSFYHSIRQFLKFKTLKATNKLFTSQVSYDENKIFPILAIEGMKSANYSLNLLKFYLKNGAKIVSLAWNEKNDFVGGSHSDGKLTSLGKQALDIIEKYDAVLDVSHLNRQSFWQVMDYYKGKVMASHSCCNALNDHVRNLTDDQIKALIERDGYIGVNFYPLFLVGEDKKAYASDIIRHIKHIVDLGGQDIVGFGSDFFGIAYTPEDVKSCVDLDLIYDYLKKEEFDDKLIENICYNNFKRFVFEEE